MTAPSGSRAERPHKPGLLRRLDRTLTISGPDPLHRILRRAASEHREACQRCSGAAMGTPAPNFDPLAVAGPLEGIIQRNQEGLRVVWKTEVGPLDVSMGPRRLPTIIQV